MFINYNTFKPILCKPLISSTLRTTNNFVLMNSNNNSKPILHPFPGLEIGIPLNIFQFVFTRLFYKFQKNLSCNSRVTLFVGTTIQRLPIFLHLRHLFSKASINETGSRVCFCPQLCALGTDG